MIRGKTSTFYRTFSWCILLMDMALLSSSFGTAAKDLGQRDATDYSADSAGSAGSAETVQQTTWSDGDTWINHMCAAQCDAFCNENTIDCRGLCKTNETRRWIIKCHESQQKEVQSSYYDPEDSYLTRESECPGTCSILKNQQEAGYFIPMTPDVVLVRDQGNHSVTLTWSRPSPPGNVLYVLQEKEETGPQHARRWSEAHLVNGGDHFTRSALSVCSTPTYRVAAVSRYGSHWFSKEVTTPDLVPGTPRLLQVENIQHDESIESFVITMSWMNPEGWELPELKAHQPFSWYNYVRCPPSLHRAYTFEDNHSYSNEFNTLTFHISDIAIGCRIIYAVSATSSCGDDLMSDRAYLTIDLSCESVKDFYSGIYCTPPPFEPPGNVENVMISVVPGLVGARAHVTWSPPSDLGTAQSLGFYMVFFGFIDQFWGFGFKDNVYDNVTLPADTLHVDVPIPDSQGEKFGILIMAGAAGQKMEYPIGLMTPVPDSAFSGRVLLEEDIVVYQIDANKVRVYWDPPSRTQRDVTGFGLQWGPVTGHRVDVTRLAANVSDGMTYNVTGNDVTLRIENATVVNETLRTEPRD